MTTNARSPLPRGTTLVSPATIATPASAAARAAPATKALSSAPSSPSSRISAQRQPQRPGAGHREIVDGAAHREVAEVAAGELERVDDEARRSSAPAGPAAARRAPPSRRGRPATGSRTRAGTPRPPARGSAGRRRRARAGSFPIRRPRSLIAARAPSWRYQAAQVALARHHAGADRRRRACRSSRTAGTSGGSMVPLSTSPQRQPAGSSGSADLDRDRRGVAVAELRPQREPRAGDQPEPAPHRVGLARRSGRRRPAPPGCRRRSRPASRGCSPRPGRRRAAPTSSSTPRSTSVGVKPTTAAGRPYSSGRNANAFQPVITET